MTIVNHENKKDKNSGRTKFEVTLQGGGIKKMEGIIHDNQNHYIFDNV